MRTLVLDIETTPNLAHVWGLWNENIPLDRLIEAGQVLCFAAKWYGERKVMFSDNRGGQEDMATTAHALLDEADAVVHYNGNAFDIPHLNREILLAGLTPPSPHKNIDLFTTVKRRFKFPSNKLAYVVKALGIGAKADTGGFDTWVGCMRGDETAWRRMRKYNIQDVRVTEALYDRLLPWIEVHPHTGIYDGQAAACSHCGSTNLQRRGFAATNLRVYQQFQCQDCGKWLRSSRSEGGAKIQAAV